MHELRKTSLYSFAVAPAIGLGLGAITHVAALSGKDGPLGNYTLLLHVGVLLVWLPAIMASRSAVAQTGEVCVVCPVRICRAELCSVHLMLPRKGGSELMTPSVVRGFSGYWMVLYATAGALLYSEANVKDWDRRCRNGHPVGAVAAFCEKCKLPLDVPTTAC